MTAKGRISRHLPERSTRQHRRQASLIITPSEGVEKSRELDTPSERVLPKSASEGVERAQKKVWHHNGTDSRNLNLLPLWKRDRKAMPSTRPAEWALRKRTFHNGTEYGICCRCGKRAEGQCRLQGLQNGCCGKGHSTTAPNHGICCRCGKGVEGQCRLQGLQNGCSGKEPSATAPIRGICCRCGKGTEGQCRLQGLQNGCCGKGPSTTAPIRG